MTSTRSVHQVDVDISVLVLQAARARLELTNRTERDQLGINKTTLADIGRAIMSNWKPPAQAYEDTNARGFRKPGAVAEVKSLRFRMNADTYRERAAQMRTCKTTVTRCLEEGLERYARTGKY